MTYLSDDLFTKWPIYQMTYGEKESRHLRTGITDTVTLSPLVVTDTPSMDLE